MRVHDNATAFRGVTFSSVEGPLFSALGVLAFSLSLTATRAALASFGPFTVGLGRAVTAALLAVLFLAVRGGPWPRRATLAPLAVVAAGVVVGSPLLMALAMRSLSASHGAIVLGLAPTLTALLATLRAGERPSRTFWAASLFGTAATVAFGLARSHGAPSRDDGIFFAAVLLVSVGYAEGGRLARTLGGSVVVCHALLVALPVTVPGLVWALAVEPRAAPTASSLAGFAYVSGVSMFLGFFAWYRGLASFGVARASQVQLAQGPLGALWSHVLLGDPLTGGHAWASLAVIASAVVASRARVTSTVASPRAALVERP